MIHLIAKRYAATTEHAEQTTEVVVDHRDPRCCPECLTKADGRHRWAVMVP